MTAQTATLTDFLLARYDEDEADAYQLARDLTRWQHEKELNGPDGTQGSIVAATIVDWPARVLAEVAAKRRIVERVQANEGITVEDDWVLNLLALPYADHSDWREEWRA